MIPPGHTFHLPLLSKQVALDTWGCGLTVEQESWVVSRLTDAFARIASVESLPQAVVFAVEAIASIIVPSDNRENLGASGTDGMTLSLPYMQDCSVAWLASLMAHEGQHHRNHGAFSGADLWRDEQSACLSQLALGMRVGFTPAEQADLVGWMRDSNQAAMQAHMAGYAGPAAP